MAKIDEMDRRERQATLNQTIKALRAALQNKEGLKRMQAISQEEWQAAEAADQTDGS